MLVCRAIEDHAVGGSGEFVWTMIAIVEQAGHASDVDVVETGKFEASIGGEQAEIASTSRCHECGGHLCMTSGSD